MIHFPLARHQQKTHGTAAECVSGLKQTQNEVAPSVPLAVVTSGGDLNLPHSLSPTTRKRSFRERSLTGSDKNGDTEGHWVLKLVSLSRGNKQPQCVSGLRQRVFISLCHLRAVGLLASDHPKSLHIPDPG